MIDTVIIPLNVFIKETFHFNPEYVFKLNSVSPNTA